MKVKFNLNYLLVFLVVCFLLLLIPVPCYRLISCKSDGSCPPNGWQFCSSVIVSVVNQFTLRTTYSHPSENISVSNSNPAWKTYIASTGDFKFKFPPNWFLVFDQNNRLFISSTDPKNGGNLAGFRIEVFSNPKITSLNTLRKFILDKYPYLDPKIYLSLAQISSLSGYKLKIDAAPKNILPTEYYLLKNNLIYKIIISEDTGFPERNEAVINAKILSSLKFTN
jgi:hypothetical protein